MEGEKQARDNKAYWAQFSQRKVMEIPPVELFGLMRQDTLDVVETLKGMKIRDIIQIPISEEVSLPYQRGTASRYYQKIQVLLRKKMHLIQGGGAPRKYQVAIRGVDVYIARIE